LGLLALAGIGLASVAPVVAQTPAEPKAWFQADRATLTVGDQVRLALFVQAPADALPQLPALPRQWGPLEILEQRERKPQRDKAGLLISGREYLITIFAPGEYVTPPLEVTLRDSAGQLQTLAVVPLTFTVTSVLTDTENAELRDLKPQADLPFDWQLVGYVALGVLAAAALALGAYLFSRRLRRPAPSPQPTLVMDNRPPEEIAYAELERIERLKLLDIGELKQHYSLSADCLRRYVGCLYDVPALDRTTDELARLLRRQRRDPAIARQALDILEESDLVKFAKARPPLEQARSLTGRVRAFVDRTKPARSSGEE